MAGGGENPPVRIEENKMGDFRIKYGSALGPQNNFYARTDNTFTSGDTTPDVTLGTLWYTANTSATSITNFDLTSTSQAGDNAGTFEGKVITIYFLDTATTLVPSARLVLASSANNTFASNSVVSFVYHKSAWVEKCGSRSSYDAEFSKQSFGSASADTNSIVVTNNTKVVGVSHVSATCVITGITGGYDFQTILLYTLGSNTVKLASGLGLVICSDNLTIAATAGFVNLTKLPSGSWYMQKDSIHP